MTPKANRVFHQIRMGSRGLDHRNHGSDDSAADSSSVPRSPVTLSGDPVSCNSWHINSMAYSSSVSSSNSCILTARAQQPDSADVYAASGTVHFTADARCLETPWQ